MSDMPDEIWVDNTDDWGIWSTDQSSQYDTRYIRAEAIPDEDYAKLLHKGEIARLRRMNGRNSEVITELETECVSLRNELARLRRTIEEAHEIAIRLKYLSSIRQIFEGVEKIQSLLEIEDR